MTDHRERNPLERRLLFRRGFRDGAGMCAIKHSDEPDYLEGYEAGRITYGKAADEFRQKYGLPEPNILRPQAPEPSDD